MFELQAKINNHWQRILRHSDGAYLKIVGDRQFSRYETRRIVKLE